MDGKLDYKEGTVLMNHPANSVYQQVIERTKGSFFRTSVLRYVLLLSRIDRKRRLNKRNYSAAVAK